ncbi:hypothetical protein FOPG_17820 [Fusarium oxysporum f. sp. conglutinans race 2 54008]|uniref:Uncharacterized protein n=1 Tax=Fusarium oxysporum f. sp. conglutinans race 2 54008 TaxID=1089457 RepID=X0GQU3_FUSOX|nr:hypothetical protein FOPG_17820 [Fusarium oxysporum f. sp. conglutinans race 2 54008]
MGQNTNYNEPQQRPVAVNFADTEEQDTYAWYQNDDYYQDDGINTGPDGGINITVSPTSNFFYPGRKATYCIGHAEPTGYGFACCDRKGNKSVTRPGYALPKTCPFSRHRVGSAPRTPRLGLDSGNCFWVSGFRRDEAEGFFNARCVAVGGLICVCSIGFLGSRRNEIAVSGAHRDVTEGIFSSMLVASRADDMRVKAPGASNLS